MFSALKANFLAIGGAIIAFLLGIIKFQSVRNKTIKKQRDNAKADLQFREDVVELDEEINQEFSHRAEEAKEALDEDRIPDHLARPRK